MQSIQNQMQQTQNRLALKREQFKVELRRQQLHTLFKKRRQELETAFIAPTHHEQSHLQEISQLIATLHHQHLHPIFKEAIEMDQSLSLLFHLTAIVPENVPAFFAQIIKSICGEKIFPEKIDLQKISQNMQARNFPKDNRLRICEHFDRWCRSEGQIYHKVKSLLNQLPQITDAATTQLIQFIALVANASLVVMWAEQSLTQEMEEHRTRRKHQLTSCNSILINMLAGKEQEIAQHIPLILYSIGNNINCIGVYFNLFLIEKVDPFLKFEIFRIFTRVLCLNHEEVLQQHKDIICMLSNCMKLLPQLPPQLQQSYLQIGFKITEMLNGLLEILNLRYESTQLYLLATSISTDDQDRAFVHHIAVILQKLSEQKYICCALLQSKPIVRFILNHLEPSEQPLVLRTACCLMSLLNVCTFESLSLEVFSKEILFVHKLMRIIIKIEMSCDHNSWAHSHMLLYIEKLLGTFTNCCHCSEFFCLFLEQNLLGILGSLYFKLLQSRKVKVKEQCLFVYLNMLVNGQNYLLGKDEERDLVLNSLLGNSRTNNLFVQSLKSTQTDLIELAVKILCFLVRVEQKSSKNQHLSSFLSNNSLSEQLSYMEQSDKERVYQCGHQAKMMLKHRVRPTTYIEEEELDCL